MDRVRLEALQTDLSEAKSLVSTQTPDSVNAEVSATEKYFAPTMSRISPILDHSPDDGGDDQRVADEKKTDGEKLMQDFAVEPVSVDATVIECADTMSARVSHVFDRFDGGNFVAVPKRLIFWVSDICLFTYCFDANRTCF